MRKDDYEGTGFCGCLILLVVLVFIVSFCSGPKDKPALDNLIETTQNGSTMSIVFGKEVTNDFIR